MREARDHAPARVCRIERGAIDFEPRVRVKSLVDPLDADDHFPRRRARCDRQRTAETGTRAAQALHGALDVRP
jgi:hypothetical protein